MPHIAFIGSLQSPHVVRWANAMLERGYKVSLISMHSHSDEINKGINVIKLPFKNPYGYVLNIPFLRKKIKSLNPDIVHSFYAFGHSFLGRKSGFKPHIVSVLGSDIFDDIHKNRLFKNIVVNNILTADVVCSTSYVMADEIRKHCGDDLKIHITPFGVDMNKFLPKKTETQNNEFVIGTVKWLEDKYGVDILIQALALLVTEYPHKKIKLCIVGNGTKEKQLKQLAKALGISDKCEFLGKVSHDKVPNILQEFDIYAALSRFESESFGVAILEASAVGLPVVVANVGGLPEVVENGKTGLVVDKENPNAAFEAFKLLIENKEEAKKMGEEGIKRVREVYLWENSLIIMERIYKQVIYF